MLLRQSDDDELGTNQFRTELLLTLSADRVQVDLYKQVNYCLKLSESELESISTDEEGANDNWIHLGSSFSTGPQ